MAEVTIYANNAGGWVRAANATLADLWDTTTGSDAYTSQPERIGYWAGYEAQELFFSFDTSTTNIPSGATINSVTFALTREAWGTHGTAGTIEAFIYDWSSGGMTTADYLSHADLTGIGRIAYATMPAQNGNVVTITFTSEAGFTSALSSSTTYIVVAHEHQRTAPDSATVGDVQVYTGAESSEPTYRPRLVVDYTEAASGCPRHFMTYARRRAA